MTDNPHAPPASQSDEALINVGPINRIPGTDSISCPGLPSGMMCLGWGEQGWAINDKDGKRIAAGNWGECATLPASQSEVLAEARHEMDIFDRPSKRTSLRLIRRVEELEAENARLREALTPSGYTKAAYIGEFHFREPDFDECGGRTYRHVAVPWTTIKEIMTAIAARAALKDKQP